MKNALAFVILFGFGTTFGQTNDFNDTFGSMGDDSETYFSSGPNWTSLERTNFSELGSFYNYGNDSTWDGIDDGDEVIEEIIVTARRRVRPGGNGLELWGTLSFGNMFGEEICTGYSDGGHCIMTEIMWDEDELPLSPRCQSASGSTAPLTAAEAEQMNVDYLNNLNTSNIVQGVLVGGLITTLTNGAAIPLWVRAMSGAAATVAIGSQGYTGDLPFAAGDVVTYSLSACNNGEGGVDGSISISTG